VTRQQDVLDALAAANAFSAEIGVQAAAGVYSGPWYINGYLGGWMPEGVAQWLAVYDGNPGSQLGGLVVGHQFTSTPIDQSVFEDSEIGGDVDAAERQAYEDRISGLTTTIYDMGDRLGDAIEAECARPNGAQPRKGTLRDIAAQLHNERAEAVGPR
jgi:hypothetical protein